MDTILSELQTPVEGAHADLGGAPLDLAAAEGTQRRPVEQQWETTLHLLQQLQHHIKQLPPLSLPVEEDVSKPEPQEYRYFGIVEIQEVEAGAGPTPQQQRQALMQQVLLALLLYVIPDTSAVAAPACTWQTERGAAPADAEGAEAPQAAAAAAATNPPISHAPQGTAGSLPQLVGRAFSSSLQLRTPWTCPRVSAAALDQLQQLNSITPGLPGQESTAEPASDMSRPSEQAQQQQEGGGHQPSSRAVATSPGAWLLVRVLPGVLQQLRPVLTAQHQHDIARDRGEAAAYKGPGVFARCLAARQLACAVQLLPPAALTQHLGLVLPLLRAAIDDPSPAVQRYGHAGVQWLAVMAGGEQLAWQQELLLHVANKMVVGCDPAVWGSALPAATRLVLVLDRVSSSSKGGNPRSAALDALLQQLITEAERSGDKPDMRLTFLACLAVLLPAVRLYAVKHLGRILPLLLEWLLLGSASSQAAAAEVLREVVRWSWPRMAAHAGVLWQYMAAAAQAEDAATEEEVKWLAWRQAAGQQEAPGEAANSGDVPHAVKRTAEHAAKAAALLELMGLMVQAAPAAVREAVQQQAQGRTSPVVPKVVGHAGGLLPSLQALAMRVPGASS